MSWNNMILTITWMGGDFVVYVSVVYVSVVYVSAVYVSVVYVSVVRVRVPIKGGDRRARDLH